jgi:RNA-directed DNA polymerase
LLRVVSGNGFNINESKTRVLPRGFRQEVTGLVVGERLNVKRSFVRQVRSMLHAAKVWGIAEAEREFYSKYNRKERFSNPDFLKVVRGKIEFVGSVRGRDDVIYVQLLERLVKLDPSAHVSAVVVTANTSTEVMQRAVWLLEERGGGIQGTAFAAKDHDLVTAAHVLVSTTEATCVPLSITQRAITVIKKEDHVDVGRLTLGVQLPVQFRFGKSEGLRVGDPVKVLGFPLHRDGSSVNIEEGRITALSRWHGVPHCVVDCAIVRGNSGGPVLNDRNEVIGIAVKGQGVPKRFANDDEQSRFVPIDFALPYLTAASSINPTVEK